MFNKEKKKKLIKFLSILADNTRLDIIELLQREKKTSAEIQTALDKSQSTISVHLKSLRENSLIIVEKIDNIQYYSINSVDIFRLINIINEFINKIEQKIEQKNFLDERKNDLFEMLL